MKNTIKLVSLLMSFIFLFSSCQAVYDAPLTPPETTANPEIDLSGEYYTTGLPYFSGNVRSGLLYEGCLIYIEKCTTTGITGYRIDPDGVKKDKYGNVDISRIVKYNPVTGPVSSPCLNPACNHSLESGCPMLLGDKYSERENYSFQGIFGDWLVFMTHTSDEEFSMLKTEIMYNLKTGELRSVFVDDLETEVISRWKAGIYYDGKYYKVNCVMDYSNTAYKPGRGQNISDYDPETKQYLCEYDFETNTSTELYEIGADWALGKVTNKRFYFRDSSGRYFSTEKDGTNEREEFQTAGTNMVGVYTINNTKEGYTVHNLTTNEFKEVTFDYLLIDTPCVTEKGVLSAHQTKYKEFDAFPVADYRNQHPNASNEEVNNAARKILASGTAQIWQCDYMGENNHVIFELPAARIKVISAYGDYVFATVSQYNTETGEYLDGYNNKACCINIVTGELTPIPELDIVVPYWYTN